MTGRRYSTNKEVVRTGYDAVAEAYRDARQQGPGELACLAEMERRLPCGAAVLDAGCGAGVPVALHLSRHFAVTGIDISAAQITLARRSVPKATFLCHDMANLHLPNESFDAICSLYAMIHVPRDEHPSLLRAFHRMLKPDGLILLCMGADDWPGTVEGFFGVLMYWSHYDARTNVRLVKDSGFELIQADLVPDGLDPAFASQHLFVLARKHWMSTAE